MCRTNGLKKLYERELTMQSKYYAVLDGLLRNFREAEAAEGLNINTADFQRIRQNINYLRFTAILNSRCYRPMLL